MTDESTPPPPPEALIASIDRIVRHPTTKHPLLLRAAGALTMVALGFMLHSSIVTLAGPRWTGWDVFWLAVWVALIALNVKSSVSLESSLHKLHLSAIALQTSTAQQAVKMARGGL